MLLKAHVEEFSLYNKYSKKYLNSFMGRCEMLRFFILNNCSVYDVEKRLEEGPVLMQELVLRTTAGVPVTHTQHQWR